jgi:hypothetical protein
LNIYVLNDLTTISANFGKFYLIEYQDLLKHPEYFGDVFETPDISYKNKVIYEVKFEKGFIKNPSARASQISLDLKNKLNKIINDLSSKKNNDPNAEQAYLILSHFETRWFDADNLTLVDDQYLINQWGISSSKLPKPLNINQSTKDENNTEDGKDNQEELGELKSIKSEDGINKSIPFFITLIILILFGLFLFLGLSDNSQTQSNLIDKNNSISSNSISSIISIVDEKSGVPIIKDLQFTFYDSNSNFIEQIDGLDAIKPFRLPSGEYELIIIHEKYYQKTIKYSLNGNGVNPRKFKLRKKGLIKLIIDKFKKLV